MADETPEVTASQDSTAPVKPPATNGAPQTPQDPDGQPYLNKGEAVGYFKRTRQVEKSVSEFGDRLERIEQLLTTQKGQTPETPTEDPPNQVRAKDVQSEFHQYKDEIAFRDSLDELEQPLDKHQRQMLMRLFRAERPSDVPQWLADNAKAFPAPKTEDAKVKETKVEQTTPVTNSGGAPAMDPRTSLPVDIFQIDGSAWHALNPKEKREHFESYKRSLGDTGNPFAARKQNE